MTVVTPTEGGKPRDGDAAPFTVDVVIAEARWSAAIADPCALADDCARAAAALEPRLRGSAALLLADDAELMDLNRRFRMVQKPTNVLSFPSAGVRGFIGDLALAYETCRREADELGIAFRDHAAHLIVHGLLHLVGHDHERDEDAERMERLEAQILARLDVADPYGDRSGRD